LPGIDCSQDRERSSVVRSGVLPLARLTANAARTANPRVYESGAKRRSLTPRLGWIRVVPRSYMRFGCGKMFERIPERRQQMSGFKAEGRVTGDIEERF